MLEIPYHAISALSLIIQYFVLIMRIIPDNGLLGIITQIPCHTHIAEELQEDTVP